MKWLREIHIDCGVPFEAYKLHTKHHHHYTSGCPRSKRNLIFAQLEVLQQPVDQ